MFYRTLAVLPALIGAWQHRGGGLSRSVGTYHDALIDDKALTRPDLLAGRQPRWLNMSRLGEILTDDALDPPIHAIVLWNANPVVSVPNAEAIRRGLTRDDLFTVVHEQLPHRHGALRRHRPPGDHPDRAGRRRCRPGATCGSDGTARRSNRVGESCSNTELFRRLARAMGYTEPSLFDDDATLLAQALGGSVDLDELKSSGWVRVPYPDDGRPFGSGEFPTASGRVELVSDCAAVDRPTVAADVRAGPRGSRR